METSFRAAGIVLISALSGCFPAGATAPPATPSGAYTSGEADGPDDATLAAEAVAAAGGADVTGAVAGFPSATAFTFDVTAGTCYLIAVAVNDAVSTQFVVSSPDASVYPNQRGNTATGRVVTHTFCTDDAGRASLELGANQMMRPDRNPAFARARFAIAASTRPELPEARAARLPVDRARFEATGRARCDELAPSAAYTCMRDLETDLAARDARAR